MGGIYGTEALYGCGGPPRVLGELHKLHAGARLLVFRDVIRGIVLARRKPRPAMRCGVHLFILDSRRVLATAPKVLGSDIKTHLESRLCASLTTKKGA